MNRLKDKVAIIAGSTSGISCHVATVAQFRRGESHTWDH